MAHGWLRVSHRHLNPDLSEPWRPHHLHEERHPLVPGEAYEVEVELWPTSIVVPAGYTIALSVRGRDYEFAGEPGTSAETITTFKNRFTGVGPFLHNDPADRPPEVFGGTTTLHLGPDRAGRLLVPIIPAG